MEELKLPTEQVELPSKGLVYPKDNPLSSGVVEMKYMTAKEEDILTNQNYISNGTVLDKLLESLVISEGVKVKDLIVGDKNAVLVAARILGYGKDYTFSYDNTKHKVDLSILEPKHFDESLITPGVNEFEFKLPKSGNTIKYKLLTGHDESKIDREIKGLKKIDKNASPDLSTRLKYLIVSINDDSDSKSIRKFVDNYLLAMDSRALREHIRNTQPDIDMNVTLDSGEEVAVPISINFFWPDY
tara:strand:+ start:621 stop:1349 length:729 start_codon:yes stop_codon:yes gene_type:complete